MTYVTKSDDGAFEMTEHAEHLKLKRNQSPCQHGASLR